MLHAPEAACGDCAFLRVLWYVYSGLALGVQSHGTSRGGEGAEETCQEGGHGCGCHEDGEESSDGDEKGER